MKNDVLEKYLNKLLKQPRETDWLEFKLNFHSFEEIGKDISAISNTACLRNRDNGYIVFGIEDNSLNVVGTSLTLDKKKGNEQMEVWLAKMLSPSLDFEIHEFTHSNGCQIVMFDIPAASSSPIRFQNESYIRVGSSTRRLKDYGEKERKIWTNGQKKVFEKRPAMNNLGEQDIINLLDTHKLFELSNIPYPSKREKVIEKLMKEDLIQFKNSKYSILNLGAILFAKELEVFEELYRKTCRVIVYKRANKLNTLRDIGV